MRATVLLMLVPAVLGAQKYQLVASLPGASGAVVTGAVGHPITFRKTTSDVVMTKADTAGDVLIRLLVTGTKVEEIVADSSAEATAVLARRTASPSTTPPTPITYEILMKKGKPFSLTTIRTVPAGLPAGATAARPQPVVLDSLNPYLNLLTRLPGLGLLVPNSAFPAAPGGTTTDRLPTHSAGSSGMAMSVNGGTSITLPPVDLTDTTTIVWTRKGDGVEGELKQHTIRKSEALNGETSAKGTPKVTFNAKGEVQSAAWMLSSSTTSIRADGTPSSSISSSSYLVSRVD